LKRSIGTYGVVEFRALRAVALAELDYMAVARTGELEAAIAPSENRNR